VSTRAALGIWTLALACAAGATVLVETSDHTSGKVATLVLAIPTALAFIASGILAQVQRPQNRTGVLLILVGFAWTLGALNTSNNDVVFTVGLLVGTIFTALLAHLLLAFPTGRLTTRADRWIASAFYVVAIVGPPLAFLFDDGELAGNSCDGPCPENLVQAFPNQTVANAILVGYALAATGLAAAVLVRLIQRWRRASPALRRALFPVFVTAAVLIGLAVVQTIIGLLISERVSDAMNWLVLAAVLAVPISFLYGLTRSRFGATTRRLVAQLSEKRDPEQVQEVLRTALRDPTLELGYLGPTGYVDVHGRTLQLPEEGGDRMTTRVGDEIFVHDAALADQPELEAVVHATHIALERGLSLRSLEASERRATALLDAIPDSMYRLSRDGTFLEFRLSETAILPVPADQLVGMTLADVLRPDAVEEVRRATARALAEGSTEVVEYTIEQPEQRDVEPLRHLEARIVRSGADEVVAIVRDITERKRQEEALESLVDEQAALSRVAVAVATETQPEILFDIVTEELGRLLGADAANLVRFAPESIEGQIVGKWSEPGVAIGEPGRTVIMDGGPLTRVHRTGRPARGEIDDPDISPRLRRRLIELGVTSVVAAPIEVSGELWGSIVVSVTGDKSFPERAEERIEKFAALVSVALANAETLTALSALAAEQAALSRVAVSVATEEPDRLFDVVTQEVALRLGADGANLVRFDPRNEQEAVVVGTWSNYEAEIAPIGTRMRTVGGPVTRVRQSAQPARGHIDDPDIIPSPLVDRLREQGVRSIFAAPIVVSGALWGAVMLSTNDDRTFSADAEARIAQFTSLVAVALANAEAHEQLSTLAEEQAALSRVAVAVATEEQRDRLFNIATEEIGRLFGARAAAIVRFLDDPDAAELVGAWDPHSDSPVELGARLPYRGGAATVVRRTGRAARVDLENTPDDVRREMEAGGVTSGVAAPIVVSGRPWGATTISIDGSDRFQPDAEERLEKFTGLVAVALANAQAREELAGLAEEQAALSRVALTAATEERPEHLFNTVSEEVGRLLGARSAATVRYIEGADESVIVGGWGREERDAVDVGARLPFQGGAIERVKRTARPARVDRENVSPEVQRTMASTEVSSQVAAPIVVSGRLWGATSVSLGPTDEFPPVAEERLDKFTHVVAVALANAQAREELAGLAAEQAAVSRVAIAAATEGPERLFDIVSEEVGRLFGAHRASTSRYAEDGTHVVIMGNWGEAHPLAIGARKDLHGGVYARVLETGQPARTDFLLEPPETQQGMREDGVWSNAAAPIVVSGRLWGATAISLVEPDVFPRGVEERLGKFTSLVAVALANAEAREELTASRARIVQAGDAARRRLERNLHDGAQQRLVTLSLTLRLAQAKLHDDTAAAQELLEASSEELASALEELRELARGLHPAILSDRGLEAALEALATRTPVPVELDHVPAGRLPPPVEAAAYYVVAESLTNVAKYADASSARVKVEQHDGYAIVEVEDDGVGGVDITRGSGLRGLADRVEALDGRLTVSSEVGRGTRVRAEIPCR
jgi:PAS domain S-box-containing protein